MKKSKMKTFFVAVVALLLIVSMAACAKDEPAATQGSVSNDTPAVAEDTPEPAPPPEPEAVPGKVLPANWNESQIFVFESGLLVDVNADWVRKVDGESIVYYFSEDSELPRLSLYYDYVRGDDDFDEFFEWWLAERFYNPEYNSGVDVIRQEYVTYNGIKGLEIDYIDNNDGTLRLAFYTLVESVYYQIRFAFEPNGDGPYRDDVAYVFNSIRETYAELNEWPTAYLPENTPIYNDGDNIQVRTSGTMSSGNIIVSISNTSIDALSKYADQMEKLGWEIYYFNTDEDGVGGGGSGDKGNWGVSMGMKEDGTTAGLEFYFNLD